MYLPTYPYRLWSWLRGLPRSPQLDPVQLLIKLLDACDALYRLSAKTRGHGVYETLDYDATLEIKDPKVRPDVLTQSEVIRFLSDNPGVILVVLTAS